MDNIKKINTNTSEVEQLQDKLQRQNLLLMTVLENAPIGFAINTIDDGKAVFVSIKFEEIYGVDRHSINNSDDFFEKVYIDPVYREEIKKKIMGGIQSGDSKQMIWSNIPITTNKGEIKFVTAINIPIPAQNLMVSTVQDVTENKLAEDEINEKIQELEKMNKFFVERELKMSELKEQISKSQDKI